MLFLKSCRPFYQLGTAGWGRSQRRSAGEKLDASLGARTGFWKS